MKFNWFVPCLLVLLSVGIVLDAWHSGRLTASEQRDTRQRFVTELAATLAAKPAFTDELLTAAAELCHCVQLRWQRRDGGAEFVAGSVTIAQTVLAEGWSYQQELPAFAVAIDQQSQLVAVFPSAGWLFNWLQIALCALGLGAAGMTGWFYRAELRQRKQIAHQLTRLVDHDSWQAQDFNGQMQLLHMIEVELLQRRQQEQEFRLQRDELTQQLHVQQSKALQQIERQQQQLQSVGSENLSWQLFARQFPKLIPAQLVPLCNAMATASKQTVEHSSAADLHFAGWYKQQFEQAMPMFAANNLLLPAEDPAICRAQIDVDYAQLAGVFHLLLELVRPCNRGPETLLGYQLLDEVRPCLLLTLQYNGAALPARMKQILKQGEVQPAEWPELVASLIHRLIADLAGSLDLQELTDVGCRFSVKIPVRIVAKPEKKLCQNMLVYDNRDCRQGLWRHALQAVAEQLLMVDSLTQLWHTAKHRLTDMVVVHLHEETVTAQELEQLKTLAQRYPMLVFLSAAQKDVARELAGIAKLHQMPVLLGAMCEHQLVDTQLTQQQLLVVDDNLTNLSFIRAMLSGMGLGIDYATSGQQAIELAEQTRYQLILMDIQLPDISGMDVTKRLRQIRHHQHTQVLAFTAHALPEEVASFKLAGMDDVLFKPLDERKIAHILQRMQTVREMS